MRRVTAPDLLDPSGAEKVMLHYLEPPAQLRRALFKRECGEQRASITGVSHYCAEKEPPRGPSALWWLSHSRDEFTHRALPRPPPFCLMVSNTHTHTRTHTHARKKKEPLIGGEPGVGD